MVFSNDVKVEKGFKGSDGSKVSSRQMETWINETLEEAHHLEIPGIILQPENKNPVHRYGIDRTSLTSVGVSNEEVDRIYRSLFVYSVGFFELLKKILGSTENNFSTITTIWKVFQILLEYCCKTDYRILIQEITDQSQRDLKEVEAKFKQKLVKYEETEAILKQNQKSLEDYNDQM